MTSPPIFSERASLSLIKPLLVESTYIPNPFFTSGRSDEDEYLLKLGFEILFISLIAGASLMYFKEILRESLPSSEIFSQEVKYPSLTNKDTSSSLNFEKGALTTVLPRMRPFLILVKQSDVGS